MTLDAPLLVPQIFLTIFILTVYFFYRLHISKAESVNFVDLLWRVFITGLVTSIGSLIVRIFFIVFADSAISQSEITINFFYSIFTGLVVIFLVSTFVVWKRLILYQKSKNLIKLWAFFEVFLAAALLFDLFTNRSNVNFNIALVFLSSFALLLSFNLKWVAYLNFRQKWTSILFILLSAIYVFGFYDTLNFFSNLAALEFDLQNRVFVMALFVFTILYAGISILVTLFNLPTSSVFERKLQEAMDFQKLSHITKGSSTIEETAELLLESCMSAVFADAAWIVINDAQPIQKHQFISEKTIGQIVDEVKNESIKNTLTFRATEEPSAFKAISAIRHPDFKSIVALPIFIKKEQIGVIALVNEVSDAFNKEMIDICITFVNQASTSIENIRLISEALENERYKEQLSIAKNVQKSLLPEKLSHNDSFDIAAYSVAADEVGGDYYDIIETERGIFSLMVGDVSGKGTSAAFNMAQLKGIFHSLARQKKFSALDFIIQANKALSKCLERSSFITASYLKIDTKKKTINHVRAGHCPSIFYSRSEKKACFLDNKGMGLGILRNSEFDQYVEESTITYQPGDLLILYTDGITEARNFKGELYDAKGLEHSILQYVDLSVNDIKEKLITDLNKFLGEEKLDDDYTIVVVKFEQ
ncbi:GAF domain-containing SpoIIE family protein phosphatase [Marinoscillum sp. MHG1-6]|uniref:GAF domain-containing SpoIIE family protein phosphatase n=1 Tax=Marinoscillum sp. MHG1-6 TaxID=2959627 RepID=UPI00215721D4|nr:PP2C family protein-serine/threonine phosphatase [Marinoscillum sp. MHG1-6]